MENSYGKNFGFEDNMRYVIKILLQSKRTKQYIEHEDRWALIFTSNGMKAKDFSNIFVLVRPFYRLWLEHKWGESFSYVPFFMYEGTGLT
jgi:hypothetical protein